MDDVVTDRSPAAQLRRQLAEARADGQTFESVWAPALNLALRGRHNDRRQWETALTETALEWEAAFNRETTTTGAALAHLAGPDT